MYNSLRIGWSGKRTVRRRDNPIIVPVQKCSKLIYKSHGNLVTVLKVILQYAHIVRFVTLFIVMHNTRARVSEPDGRLDKLGLTKINLKNLHVTKTMGRRSLQHLKPQPWVLRCAPSIH